MPTTTIYHSPRKCIRSSVLLRPTEKELARWRDAKGKGVLLGWLLHTGRLCSVVIADNDVVVGAPEDFAFERGGVYFRGLIVTGLDLRDRPYRFRLVKLPPTIRTSEGGAA